MVNIVYGLMGVCVDLIVMCCFCVMAWFWVEFRCMVGRWVRFLVIGCINVSNVLFFFVVVVLIWVRVIMVGLWNGFIYRCCSDIRCVL